MKLIPSNFYLDEIFDDFFAPTPATMKYDIYEKDGLYHIEMDIPGFDKKDISIEEKDGYIKIEATKKAEKEDKDKNYIRRERNTSSYSRSIYLGNIDKENINASFKDGILNITVPKKEKIESKNIVKIN